jgi:myo-inositol-1(or 4)-monophosphatase
MTRVERILREAGALLLDFQARGFTVEHKGAVDLVTEADRASESLIVSRLRDAYPDDAVLTEEERSHAGVAGGRRWILDPLDGTTNFAHGFPCFAISLALEREGTVALAAVFDPTRDEFFSALRGEGARRNGEPIHVSRCSELDRALLATGFPYDVRTSPDNNLREFGAFALRAQAVRRAGAAALDLCYVAAGRFDGFWEAGLKPWDVAGGWLLVEEAGGAVSDYLGDPFDLSKPDVVASNGRIHDAIVAVLREARG